MKFWIYFFPPTPLNDNLETNEHKKHRNPCNLGLDFPSRAKVLKPKIPKQVFYKVKGFWQYYDWIKP